MLCHASNPVPLEKSGDVVQSMYNADTAIVTSIVRLVSLLRKIFLSASTHAHDIHALFMRFSAWYCAAGSSSCKLLVTHLVLTPRPESFDEFAAQVFFFLIRTHHFI